MAPHKVAKNHTKVFILLLFLSFLFILAIEDGVAFNPNASIWISPDELAVLPMKGRPWDCLKDQALAPSGSAKLSNQNQKNNIYVLAKALVYTRCVLTPFHAPCPSFDYIHLRTEVIAQIMAAIGTEQSGRTLALGRELAAYIIAADLVGLPSDMDQLFRKWLRQVRTTKLHGKTLISTHEDRPNNWGTHAGASRAAVAIYLKDTDELRRTAQVFKGYLGDRSSYAGFKYGSDLSWQCDPIKPMGINSEGCQKDGHPIDGVLPDDQRRGGSFTWPPPKENYVYEGLQGALAQAYILYRAGYDTFNWENKALLRAYKWLHDQANFPAQGDDTWQMPLVDHIYGTKFWDGSVTRYGKNVGWTDWTHAKGLYK